ncbi:hypothetical protein [Methanobrevibacter sp.]|uniref:hypothetical protein n=1 Tax=Methanobrevibacter sp. TaxID=66852 RepID=UPI00388F113C
MDYYGFSRFMLINFISSILITIIVWFCLYTIQLPDVMYLGAFFGMYVFAYFGVNLIVDDEIIPNNYYRVLLAAICLLIYLIVFMYMMPLIFGPGVFPADHTISSIIPYGGFGSDFVLNTNLYLAIFTIIILALNVYHMDF